MLVNVLANCLLDGLTILSVHPVKVFTGAQAYVGLALTLAIIKETFFCPQLPRKQ